ncbi:MAG TPA: hypothetical protein VFO94_14070 [Gammaproteobacteria bacterium]|nr:hypothetical protein [Gammaproteobacteria bacterium]
MIAEAIAICEAAQLELERLQEEIRQSIAAGRAVTASMVAEEKKAREGVLVARLSLVPRRSS